MQGTECNGSPGGRLITPNKQYCSLNMKNLSTKNVTLSIILRQEIVNKFDKQLKGTYVKIGGNNIPTSKLIEVLTVALGLNILVN